LGGVLFRRAAQTDMNRWRSLDKHSNVCRASNLDGWRFRQKYTQ
jgi:hypothetical protein